MTTREKILDVAYRSFADKGYNRTSMGSIAEELGITRPALYYHFASKEDLLLATYKMVDPLVDVNVDDVLASTSVEQYRRELDALIAHITATCAMTSGAIDSSRPSSPPQVRYPPCCKAPVPNTTRHAPYSRQPSNTGEASGPCRPNSMQIRQSNT